MSDFREATDYEPVDLSGYCNIGPAVLDGQAPAPTGRQLFHGLPFRIGSERGLIGLGGDLGSAPLSIRIGRPAKRIIYAHRLLEPEFLRGAPLGVDVADYVVHFADGHAIATPIRERYQIATVPTYGSLLFDAVIGQKSKLRPRYVGEWGKAGDRQMEIDFGDESFVLWAWANPRPDRVVERIEIIPRGPRFLIGGITLSHLEEHPFVREGRREVKIVLPRADDAARPFDLAVDVDRGVATYPWALPTASADEFLADDCKGWGETQNPSSSPAYVEIAAIPSATVTIRHGDDVVGSVRWGDVEERTVVEPGPRLWIELVDRGRNWVHTRIVDDETGQPIPCRIHFRSPEGIPYQPYGHHAHVNSNQGTFHVDIGGDLRLGQITYAYVDGTCQGWLPRGDVIVDVARGFEYRPLRQKIRIEPGQQHLELRLKRWCEMKRERWFSGDTHVHFLSTTGGQTEARGEDLNVVNVLQSQWGHLFSNVEDFVGRPIVSPDGQTIVYVSQENRQHFMGHLTLLGLKRPVMPWNTDGPGEDEIGGTIEITMADWADQCHAQGGTVVLPHVGTTGETPVLIATGRADAAEFHRFSPPMHAVYYRYLNGGYKVPLVGGTDKMYSEVPVGLYRTYVYIPPDEEFTYESWCRNLARGRTIHSGGPILDFSVDGHRVGDTVQLPGNGGTVEVEAAAGSIFPIHRLEVVQQGRVVAATEDLTGTDRLALRTRLKIESHTWLAARVAGPDYVNARQHHDLWGRHVFGHTSPIYIACGGEWWLYSAETTQYMLTLIEGTLAYIRQNSAQYPDRSTTHHHGEADHRAYLERPFLEARERIHRRMHELGVDH